ncbi:Uncharacterised protein [Vibrio cholerae]|uniref:Uncharacterized protein n=1 Tax=Vibrio cholerae TaxID=666 RepID=A0A655QCK6_VIBCL|nr:Uncharacterised protein [Vibrio cholerae]CSB59828.1 Uncharacterised protein [Vibrio cholerae]CSC65780.1 Uncharacterised protein [Vibrio cholerae]CSC78267.1 Uncharacterised protein [Vibrio cholerae]CSC99918.1 Uncharacterised protein [Vibrio cholerae]
MRVIFTDYVTYHTGRFFIGFVPVVAQHIHREQYASVYWFKAITHIRKSTTHDNRHRVVQIRTA